MEKKTNKYCFIVIIILLSTLGLLSVISIDPDVDSTDLALSLPDVKPFTSESIVFCESMDCGQSFLKSKIENSKCLHCGSSTGVMSPVEKNMLPDDTTIIRQLYTSPDQHKITASIVISGKERTGIHRPQMCLPAQGYTIERQYTKKYNITEGKSLNVTVLDLKAHGQQKADIAYIYWFVSRRHTTPYHIERTLITFWDNLVNGISSQWGYVAFMSDTDYIESEEFSLLIRGISSSIYHDD